MKAVKTVEQAGRKSWLAGMGMCGEGVEKSTDTLDKLYVNSNAFIQDLIVKGEQVEAKLSATLKNNVKGKSMLEDKIALLRAKLGMHNNSRDIQLEKLSTKVDNLIEVVAKLAQQKQAEQTAKTAAKPAAAKSSAKSASAPAADKSAGTTKATTTKSTASKAAAKPRTRKTAAKKPAADKSE